MIIPRETISLDDAITLVRMSDLVLTRTVAESQSERSEIIFPADANALGNLFGGR